MDKDRYVIMRLCDIQSDTQRYDEMLREEPRLTWKLSSRRTASRRTTVAVQASARREVRDSVAEVLRPEAA